MMKAFRTYFLNNFQIYHAAVLTIVIMLCIISPELISYMWKFAPFHHLRPILPPPYLAVLTSLSQCLDYYSFTIRLEFRKCKSSKFVLAFQSACQFYKNKTNQTNKTPKPAEIV